MKTPQLWREFWGILIEKVRERTLAEWQQVFVDRPDISAEIFRQGPDVLEHPQLTHDGRVITLEGPGTWSGETAQHLDPSRWRTVADTDAGAHAG